MNRARITGLLLIGVGLLVLTLELSHAYDLAPVVGRLSVKAGPGIAGLVKRVQPERVVYGLLVFAPLCVGAIFLVRSSRVKPGHAEEPAELQPVSRPVVTSAKSKGGQAPVHSCNVLEVGAQERKLWQFEARNGGFVLNREQVSFASQALPSGIVSKDWRSLWQRKLNVAWLPPERVFLRVAQFPQSEFGETLAMVELQLEKLSPLPVAQIAWSIQVLPHTDSKMQTVVVIIVARDAVEEFLGKLEGQGYLTDALELPVLDQLNATTIKEDGVWIYPEALGGKNSGLAAWWYGGVLQNLDFLTLSPTDPATGVKEQLTQMAWAGELEGWMTSEPRYHLVASPGTAAQWDPVLREGLGQSVEHVEPLSPPQLAAATAARAAQAHPHANLLPAEFSTRYHQQFIDRLWMRGLLAVGGLYLLGVLIYGVALGVGSYRVNRVETRVAELSHSYTNAIQLKARYQILKDRQDLKYAALDCWKAVAELLPDSIALESWNFIDGKKLNLSGTAPPGQVQELLDFDPALRRHLVNGQPLFDSTQGDYVTYHTGQGGTLLWGLTLVLKRSEAP